jgi:hypothetical protein
MGRPILRCLAWCHNCRCPNNVSASDALTIAKESPALIACAAALLQCHCHTGSATATATGSATGSSNRTIRSWTRVHCPLLALRCITTFKIKSVRPSFQCQRHKVMGKGQAVVVFLCLCSTTVVHSLLKVCASPSARVYKRERRVFSTQSKGPSVHSHGPLPTPVLPCQWALPK